MTDDPKKPQRFEQPMLFPDMVSEYREGKDELNLAEFPIAALSNRVIEDAKTMVFEDTTHDRSTGEMVTRKLTITASDAYGLPTSSDDEVLLGLLQLTRQQGFRSPWVHFTVYQLLQVLGWTIHGRSYERVYNALNRWHGVSLYYDNAWRDRATNQWVDQKFHFLEVVEIYHKGKNLPKAGDDVPEKQSRIKWNDRVFQSFQAGNLKAIDFQLFRNLENAIAKRMYRFLDKRFHHRHRLTFDLEKFAFDKLGLPRSYKDMAQIKRRLEPGITELERVGFIEPLPMDQRYTKTRGIWEIRFEKAMPRDVVEQPPLPIEVEDLSPTEGRLVGHGVTKSQARKMVTEHDDIVITTQLDALEYLLTKKGATVPENRAGWLVKAIQEGYALPKGFRTRAEVAQDAKRKAEADKARAEARRRKEEAERAKEAAEKAKEAEDTQAIAEYLAKLSPEETVELEAKALEGMPPQFTREGSVFRRSMINTHVLKLLGRHVKP